MKSKHGAAPQPIVADIKFSPEQHELCLKCLRTLHDFMPIMDKAEACGVDCARYRDVISQETELLESIRKHFMQGDIP